MQRASPQNPTKGGTGRRKSIVKEAEQSGWTDEQISVLKEGIAEHGSDRKAIPKIIKDDSKVGVCD